LYQRSLSGDLQIAVLVWFECGISFNARNMYQYLHQYPHQYLHQYQERYQELY